MFEIFAYFSNEFYVFALIALGMVLCYMADKQDKKNSRPFGRGHGYLN
ncbi:MAG: hypothetical protein FWC70_06820 [Defluviitaleaceae bacterium]|nr:hypothetical protein [Defluviitaleaceae bacterium]